MNEIVNKSSLIGDKFMPELLLRHPGFCYSACGPFTKHHESNQKFNETGDLNYLYKNKLDQISFAYDAPYANSNDVAKRTVSDKV